MYVLTLCQVDVLFHTEWSLLVDPYIEYHLYHSKLENTESMCISMVVTLKDLHFLSVLEVSVQETNQILHQTDERAVIIRILGTWIKALIKLAVGTHPVLGLNKGIS